ncbi:CRISPR-associated endonuclease Cas2 [Enterococcus alcedinis]|uniref:CRISPR-associated endoribonuclease Cas2 n=1 Tax=Enterococcus alcedinis TaxID=1274384 RepID=A0A917JK53_9ENTE|nr:CRISPR-associated endonuclease Cas2 [Enterococcus alcedinis]MBP2103230.1 CRISPR-associated protein Cas2 [Enterococcus alcedinis]GGI66779.1 CRISPR-associated endoribonuclease Cas2 [Enterococcus alcedinis]
MLILVSYDVATSTEGGTKRLRKVAKICQNYGQRVQNSVFECIVDSTQYEVMKNELTTVINSEVDSLRFYRLGKNYKSKVKHIGAKPSIDIEGTLIF